MLRKKEAVMFPYRLTGKAFLAVIAIASFSSSGRANEPAAGALTAQQILERMAAAYASCTSYRDSGVVKTTFVESSRRRTVEKLFRTAFVRPDRFRFEYRENQDRYIVCREGDTVQTWWDIKPGVEKPATLGLALAGATGVSGGSAHTVPALLLPVEVTGRRLTDMTQAVRIDDGKLGDAGCLRVEGKLMKQSITLWIDMDSFLLRRVDAKIDFANFRTEETTTYDPEINGDVPEAMLKFDSPGQK
jgi:outer membrane lipoprotein-sorting protein